MNEYLPGAQALDGLSDHALNQMVNGDEEQQGFWNERLEHYLARSEDVLDRAAKQRQLDQEWAEHLKAEGRKRTPAVVKRLRRGTK